MDENQWQQMMQQYQSQMSGIQGQLSSLQNVLNSGQVMTMGDQGYMTVGGGTNRYGQARPGTVLMRDQEGNLDPRFVQSMSPQMQALSDKAMTEGDTVAAQLARERQGIMAQASQDALQRQGASALAGGMRNLAMRGGAGIGSRERLNRDIARGLMTGQQGIGRENRLANLAISSQDEAMKNQLLGQTGMVAQKVEEANINRLQQDILNQNLAAQKLYEEDMRAFAAQKSSQAQAAAACFIAGTEFLMADGSYKAIEEIELKDHMVDGGKVYFLTKSLSNDVYEYKGDMVTGSHAVFEDGKFIRVEDSDLAKKVDGEHEVYCLGNENHLMISHNAQYSDFFETDRYEELTIDESLEALNEGLD